MKKIKLYFVLASLLSAMNAAAANVCVDNYGTLHCEEGSVDSIHYRGFVEVDGTTVLGDFNVAGNVDIRSAKLASMSVRGGSYINDTLVAKDVRIIGNVTAKSVVLKQAANLIGNFYGRNSEFHGNTHIVGMVKCDGCRFYDNVTLIGEVSATKSTFAKSIILNAKNSYFIQSTIQDIYVKKPSDVEQQRIELSAGTSVHNIEFASNRGLVILRGNSVITGKVTGGDVVRQ